jgi:hypothetical protein
MTLAHSITPIPPGSMAATPSPITHLLLHRDSSLLAIATDSLHICIIHTSMHALLLFHPLYLTAADVYDTDTKALARHFTGFAAPISALVRLFFFCFEWSNVQTQNNTR